MNSLDKKYIEKFLSSQDMRNYLKMADISILDIAQIIYGASCSVDEKNSAIKDLLDEHQDDIDEYSRLRIEVMIDNIEKAIKAKGEEGIYSLETCFYEEKEKCSNSVFEFLYLTYEEAIIDIINFFESFADDHNELVWFVVTKWGKNAYGKLSQQYTYFIIENELRYINSYQSDIACTEDMIGGGDLNLPVPFEAGDIVEINVKPFAPKFHALILSIGDNMDCCCVQGLARDAKGLWNIGAVKHGMIGVQPFPMPSMLYGIGRYNGPLDDEDLILVEISSYMKKRPDKVNELFEQIAYCGELTDEELRGLINRTD